MWMGKGACRPCVDDSPSCSKPKSMPMKTLKVLFLAAALTTPVFAADTDADQKWSVVVEKIIAEGKTTISTPSEKRVEIAKQIAQKAGRKVEVTKSDSGYRIKVQ